MADLGELAAAIEVGDRASAVRLTSEALDASVSPQEILDAMTAAMGVIGRKFQDGDIFVPEMLIAARAMKEATAILEPVLVDAGIRPEHTAVIGTVEGDLHDIGKNLVGMMLKGAAINVVDLGVNVPAARFVDAAREHGAQLIGLSALLTTTMPNMRKVVEAIKASDRRREGDDRRGADDTRVRRADRRRRIRPGRRGRGRPGQVACSRRAEPMPGMFETYGEASGDDAQALDPRQARPDPQDLPPRGGGPGPDHATSSGAASATAGARSWACRPTPTPTTTTTSTSSSPSPTWTPTSAPSRRSARTPRRSWSRPGFETTIRKRFDLPMPEQVSWETDTIEKLEAFEFDDPWDRRRYFEAGDNQIAGVGDGFERNSPPWVETVKSLCTRTSRCSAA